ncbi:putative chorismate mutase [Streptomyces sp. Tu6071]|nr:putative chorismate mutase [Streptomyces sp. Tu6071]
MGRGALRHEDTSCRRTGGPRGLARGPVTDVLGRRGACAGCPDVVVGHGVRAPALSQPVSVAVVCECSGAGCGCGQCGSSAGHADGRGRRLQGPAVERVQPAGARGGRDGPGGEEQLGLASSGEAPQKPCRAELLEEPCGQAVEPRAERGEVRTRRRSPLGVRRPVPEEPSLHHLARGDLIPEEGHGRVRFQAVGPGLLPHVVQQVFFPDAVLDRRAGAELRRRHPVPGREPFHEKPGQGTERKRGGCRGTPGRDHHRITARSMRLGRSEREGHGQGRAGEQMMTDCRTALQCFPLVVPLHSSPAGVRPLPDDRWPVRNAPRRLAGGRRPPPRSRAPHTHPPRRS